MKKLNPEKLNQLSAEDQNACLWPYIGQMERENEELNMKLAETEKSAEMWRERCEAVKHAMMRGGDALHNIRGAGRKRSVTDDQIANMQMLRAQGMTIKDIARELKLGYGTVQGYLKDWEENNG
ncbi:MAG: helix-turn-helix domain-containing protein [Lactococcus sp.]|uniref:helix-turn-helix domain-containing protein n=1 Tax=Lactococcus sp. TaxID=44273 RepID=UPI002FCB6077